MGKTFRQTQSKLGQGMVESSGDETAQQLAAADPLIEGVVVACLVMSRVFACWVRCLTRGRLSSGPLARNASRPALTARRMRASAC